jgi:hypothetical protein
MARPARVRMRSRKPWVFARRRLFGWNVRLLTRGLQERVQYGHRWKVRGPQVRRNSYGTGPPPTRSNLAALRKERGSTASTTHSSQWTQAREVSRANCGERLEAQGGTLLASHGPDLIEGNRRSSEMMHLGEEPRCSAGQIGTVLRTQVVDDSVDERPLDNDEYPQ